MTSIRECREHYLCVETQEWVSFNTQNNMSCGVAYTLPELFKISRSLHAIFEQYCNGVTEEQEKRLEKREERLLEKARELVVNVYRYYEKPRSVTVDTQRDPRGANSVTITIVLTNGRKHFVTAYGR